MEPESLPISKWVSELATQHMVSSWNPVSVAEAGDPSAWYNCSVAPEISHDTYFRYEHSITIIVNSNIDLYLLVAYISNYLYFVY